MKHKKNNVMLINDIFCETCGMRMTLSTMSPPETTVKEGGVFTKIWVKPCTKCELVSHQEKTQVVESIKDMLRRSNGI